MLISLFVAMDGQLDAQELTGTAPDLRTEFIHTASRVHGCLRCIRHEFTTAMKVRTWCAPDRGPA